MKYFSLISIVWLVMCTSLAFAQIAEYPHILVKPADKPAILDKIKTQPWAQSVYENMQKRVDQYANQHQTDPDWILSRYLMNWAPGKHYTDFYSFDNKPILLDSVGGNAPFPTVRVAMQGRTPVNKNGTNYKLPKIEDLVPYDTSVYMYLYNPDTKTRDKVKPNGYIETINEKINSLALESAILYWLTGKEQYAKLSADILSQWARGAWYQNPIHGRRTYGFIGLQTLNDHSYQPLILAYDFLFPYLKANGYEMKYYQDVFEKFAHTMLVNGYRDCNWYAAESTTLVYAALSLNNKEKQDYYLAYFLDKDTIDGRWGHTSLKTTVDTWLTEDGHWKEPGGYHTYPVSNLLRAALAMEKNGYRILSHYPSLFQSASVMMKYTYPNLYISSYGDTHRSFPSPELLELAMVFAKTDSPGEMPQLEACYNTLIDNQLYSRIKADYFGLLTYIPEAAHINNEFNWPRSASLEFAQFYLQRNGMDKNDGLMYTIQGASYNHNHINGMSMELYGGGEIMGIDPGIGPFYEHPLHTQYFCQWAAHNTVVAAGKSSELPVVRPMGGYEIGELKREAMEPMPGETALSPFVSFTDTRYTDQSTDTRQQRTMALIRTSDETGYYVDVFRSDNPVRNDYMYHNIGNSVQLQNAAGKPVKTNVATIPLVDNDKPGFRFIESVQSTGIQQNDMVALFALNDLKPKRVMRAFIPGNNNRNYFTGLSPKSSAAGSYSAYKVPTLMIQSLGEAWSKPFVVVYEPSLKSRSSIKHVVMLTSGDQSEHAALKVESKGHTQYIFQGMAPELTLTGKDYYFSGYFGVVSLSDKQIEYMYLGKGKSLSFGDYAVTGTDKNCSFHISFSEKSMTVSCNQQIEINIKNEKYVCPEGVTNYQLP